MITTNEKVGVVVYTNGQIKGGKTTMVLLNDKHISSAYGALVEPSSQLESLILSAVSSAYRQGRQDQQDAVLDVLGVPRKDDDA